jgi:hypothetical protein
VSADSRQVYRHLDVGTAKRGGARACHHGLDLADPDEIRRGALRTAALAAVEEIAGERGGSSCAAGPTLSAGALRGLFQRRRRPPSCARLRARA